MAEPTNNHTARLNELQARVDVLEFRAPNRVFHDDASHRMPLPKCFDILEKWVHRDVDTPATKKMRTMNDALAHPDCVVDGVHINTGSSSSGAQPSSSSSGAQPAQEEEEVEESAEAPNIHKQTIYAIHSSNSSFSLCCFCAVLWCFYGVSVVFYGVLPQANEIGRAHV